MDANKINAAEALEELATRAQDAATALRSNKPGSVLSVAGQLRGIANLVATITLAVDSLLAKLISRGQNE